MAYQPDNGRVTNAILSTKLDALSASVATSFTKLERRIDFLEEKLDCRVTSAEAHCQENETKIARLEERQKATTGVMGVIQAATIAATTWLGLS